MWRCFLLVQTDQFTRYRSSTATFLIIFDRTVKKALHKLAVDFFQQVFPADVEEKPCWNCKTKTSFEFGE